MTQAEHDHMTDRGNESQASEESITESPTGDVHYDPAALKDAREKMGLRTGPRRDSGTSEEPDDLITESPTGDVHYDPAALKDAREKMGG